MKNKFIKYSLLGLMFMLSKTKSIAQTNALQPSKMVVISELLNVIKTPFTPEQNFGATDTLMATMIVVVNDTLNLNKLYVKFGTTAGGSNLLSKTFVFNQVGNFNDGTAYERKGNIIYLTLGQNFMGLNTFYAEVKLENNSLQQGTPFVYTNADN
jgi:hypothetical protein